MRGLEAAAAATLGICLVPFLRAWDLNNQGGRKYRETVKKFWYFSMATLAIPTGMIFGIFARMLAPLDPRPINSYRGTRSYVFRRNYRGRHFSGISVSRTLHAAMRRSNALAA